MSYKRITLFIKKLYAYENSPFKGPSLTKTLLLMDSSLTKTLLLAYENSPFKPVTYMIIKQLQTP